MDAAAIRAPLAVRHAQLLLLGAALVSLACGMTITYITARTVGPESLGLFALVATVLTVARDATDLGTASVAARRMVASPEEESRALADLIGWRAGPCLLAALILLVVAYNEASGGSQLVWMGAAFCMLLYVNHGFSALFQARERLDVPARLNIGTQLAALAACAMLAATSTSVHPFAALIIAREATFALLLALSARRELGRYVVPNLGMLRPSKAFESTGTIALAAMAYQIGLVGPLVLLSWTSDERQLGIYGLAFRLLAPFFSFAWIVAAPLLPELARASGGEVRWQAFRRAAVMPAAAALVGCLLLWIVVDDAVVVLFGADYADTAGPLLILCFACAANIIAAFAVTALIGAGANDRVLWIGVSALVISMLCSILLVSPFGAVGAAASVAITIGLAAAASAIMLRNG
jgi:O-antigen/teichoic acid export membrane protein